MRQTSVYTLNPSHELVNQYIENYLSDNAEQSRYAAHLLGYWTLSGNYQGIRTAIAALEQKLKKTSIKQFNDKANPLLSAKLHFLRGLQLHGEFLTLLFYSQGRKLTSVTDPGGSRIFETDPLWQAHIRNGENIYSNYDYLFESPSHVKRKKIILYYYEEASHAKLAEAYWGMAKVCFKIDYEIRSTETHFFGDYHFSTKTDPKSIASWLKQAIDLGYSDAGVDLAVFLNEKNPELADFVCQFRQDYVDEKGESAPQIIDHLLKEKNPNPRALMLRRSFREAAQLGFPEAFFQLRDFQSAADLGHPNAMFSVSLSSDSDELRHKAMNLGFVPEAIKTEGVQQKELQNWPYVIWYERFFESFSGRPFRIIMDKTNPHPRRSPNDIDAPELTRDQMRELLSLAWNALIYNDMAAYTVFEYLTPENTNLLVENCETITDPLTLEAILRPNHIIYYLLNRGSASPWRQGIWNATRWLPPLTQVKLHARKVRKQVEEGPISSTLDILKRHEYLLWKEFTDPKIDNIPYEKDYLVSFETDSNNPEVSSENDALIPSNVELSVR